MSDRAELAGEHHLAGALQRRDVAIGEIDHVDDAGPFGRLRHLQRRRIVLRQRLFAEDMFARGNQRHRRRVMDAVGRDICRRIEFTPGDRLLQRKKPLFDVELVGEGRKPLGIGVDGADHRHAIDEGEAGELVFRHHPRAKNE